MTRNLIIIISLIILNACTMNTANNKSEKKADLKQKTMADFGIQASNIFLFYKDLEKASNFYANTLGLEVVSDYEFAKIFRIAEDSYIVLVDSEKGMHHPDDPKTVALALITDQLDEWYAYLKTKDVEIKYDYKPKEGSPHDGFVIYDSEGYLLEFERFNPHEENLKFIPILNQSNTLLNTSAEVPKQLGFKASISWLYYKDLTAMQKFYEEILGLEFIVDQGWCKIYQVSNTGFIGLVDEAKGMHHFTEKKAVTISFFMEDPIAWFDYVKENKCFTLRDAEIKNGSLNRYKAFVGIDPENYYMEFDRFYPHEDNTLLLKYLNK